MATVVVYGLAASTAVTLALSIITGDLLRRARSVRALIALTGFRSDIRRHRALIVAAHRTEDALALSVLVTGLFLLALIVLAFAEAVSA